jgi:Flp pilus assembly pilin Flp
MYGGVAEMITMISAFVDFASRLRTAVVDGQEGQTFVEYALLITFVALIALVAIQVLGNSISSIFSSVAAAF